MNALNQRTSTVYDAAGQSIASVDPLNRRTSTVYDGAGRSTVSINALGQRTSTVYDAAGQSVASIDPLNRRTSTVYDGAGRSTVSINALGQRTSTVYDAAGQSIASVDPLNRRTSTVYDGAGRSTVSINALGQRTSTVYDAAGQSVGWINGLGYRTSHAYDAVGRRVRRTDANGHRTTFLFDPAGQDVGRVDGLGRRTTFAYDLAGRRSAQVDARGARVSTLYDAAGQRIGETLSDGTRSTYAYDPAGRRVLVADVTGRTSTVYDAAGQTISVAQPLGKRVTYAFDAAGRRRTLRDPDGGRTTYAHDAAGQLVALTSPQDGRTTFAYDLAGRERVKWLANGVRVTHAYDAAGGTLGVSTGGAAGLVRRLTYTLDAVGRRNAIAANDGARTTYAYDSAGQLSRESRSASGIDATHVYDPAGNRAVHIDSGARTTFQYDDADQLLVARAPGGRTTFQYDAAGNRTRSDDPAETAFYTWDPRGRMASAEPVAGLVTFTYDGIGRRATKTVSGGTTRYVWDFRKLLQEADGDGTTETQYLSTEAEYGDLVSGHGSGGTRHFAFDALGSTEALLDDSGSATARFEYRAYGLTTESESGGSPGLPLPAPLPAELGGGTAGGTGEPFAFVGRQHYYRDTETGLYLLGAGGSETELGRMYDPSTVRFLSKDPLEEAGGSPNLYLYCANDPVNKTDPSGNAIGVKYDQVFFCNKTQQHLTLAAEVLRDEIFSTFGPWSSWGDRVAHRLPLVGEIYRRDPRETWSHTYWRLGLFDGLPIEAWEKLASPHLSGHPKLLRDWIDYGVHNDVAISPYEIAPNRYALDWGVLQRAGSGAQIAKAIRDLGGALWDNVVSPVLTNILSVAQVALLKIGRAVGASQEFLDAIELLGKYGTEFASRPLGVTENVFGGLARGFKQFQDKFPTYFGNGLKEWLGPTGTLVRDLSDKQSNFASLDGLLSSLAGAVGYSWDEFVATTATALEPDELGLFADALQAFTRDGTAATDFFGFSWPDLGDLYKDLQLEQVVAGLRQSADGVIKLLVESLVVEVVKRVAETFLGFIVAPPLGAIVQGIRLFVRGITWFLNNRERLGEVITAVQEATAFAVFNRDDPVGHAANKFEFALGASVAPVLSGLATLVGVHSVPKVLNATLEALGSALAAPASALVGSFKRSAAGKQAAVAAGKAGPDGAPGARFQKPVAVAAGDKYHLWADVQGVVWLRAGSGAEAVDRKLLPLLGKSVKAKGGADAQVSTDANRVGERVRAVGTAQREARAAAPPAGVKEGASKSSKRKGLSGSKAQEVTTGAKDAARLLEAVAKAIEVSGCAVQLKRAHQCFIWDVWVHGSERWFRMGRGQVGMWVRTSGPKGEVAGVEPDAASWCVVRLRRERLDGGWCEADLLRPRSWLGGAGVGCWVPVNLPEMGAHGLFRVLSVEPCPRVEPRPGEGFGLVTGAFRHGACRVLNVWLAGERDAIGVTGLHPFWSADRCGWVPAGSLQEGERVQGLDGPVRVLRVEERGDEPVFNLEVDADHCYRVGEQGILVHNSSEVTGDPDPECNPDCDFDLPFFKTPMKVGEVRNLPGKNPNNLKIEKVAYRTHRAGVYLKIHVYKNKIKIGSASNFADRYTDTAPAEKSKYQGGCRIRYEIVIERSEAYAEPGPNCPKTWTAKRQRQYDEEYVQRLVSSSMKYQAEEEAQNAVDYDCWVKCRHVFGYASVAEDFGDFLTAVPGGGRKCKA